MTQVDWLVDVNIGKENAIDRVRSKEIAQMISSGYTKTHSIDEKKKKRFDPKIHS